MFAQTAGDLLHRFDARAHGLKAPEIQEHAGPGRGVVFPELLKIFFEEVGSDDLEVVAQQIAQADLLLRSEILLALQQTPTRFLQRLIAIRGNCPSSKMRLTTKVRVSNGSNGSVSGDPQIAICGMQQGVTSLLRPSRGSLYAS